MKYLKDTGDGFWMSYDSGAKLANYIQDLKEKMGDMEKKIATLETSLKEERKQVDLIIESKNNVIQAKNEKIKIQNDIIELKTQQVRDLKELYRNKDPSIFEKAGWAAGGAGVAAVLILLMMGR